MNHVEPPAMSLRLRHDLSSPGDVDMTGGWADGGCDPVDGRTGLRI